MGSPVEVEIAVDVDVDAAFHEENCRWVLRKNHWVKCFQTMNS
jgi:hypothetical protein